MSETPVRRRVTLMLDVIVETVPQMMAADVLHRVEEAIYSGLEHSGTRMLAAKLHCARFGELYQAPKQEGDEA